MVFAIITTLSLKSQILKFEFYWQLIIKKDKIILNNKTLWKLLKQMTHKQHGTNNLTLHKNAVKCYKK